MSTCNPLSWRVVWYTTITLLAANTPVKSITVSQGDSSARFYRRRYMDNNIIMTSATTVVGVRNDTRSSAECAAACLSEERCGSFFHVPGEGMCQMHSILFLAADEAESRIGTTYWQLTQDVCPYQDGFVLYRPLKLCYQYHFNEVFWDNAAATCAGQGASLLRVDNADKFQHLYDFLRGSKATRQKHVSIGASEATGTWKWPDGSDVTWFNWADNEPSSPAEKCSTMAWFFYFKWNDVPCNTDSTALYYFICQKNI